MADTIAAIATGGTVPTAIGMIRLSGDRALEITDRVFFPRSGRRMDSYPDRLLVYGELRDEKGAAVDICLCTVSRTGHSYTGEDTAEFQMHGSPAAMAEALRLLFAAGARQALPGEFTRRAFVNGCLDLTGAEAVADLIHAETPEAVRQACTQLGGAIFARAEEVYSALTDVMSHFHAVLDYPDEDIDDFELRAYAGLLGRQIDALSALLRTFESGRIVRDGVRAAIIGKPNVGKSSLLNALLGYDRAIVTDLPGTTRDTIEEKTRLGGVLLRLVDTAGLRDTDDAVEKLGVGRSVAAARSAQLAIAVFDGSRPLSGEDFAVIGRAGECPRRIALINKSDLAEKLDAAELDGRFERVLRVSARTGAGLDELGKAVRELFPTPESGAGAVLTNARQADAVARALEALRRAAAAAGAGFTPDAVLTEVEGAMAALGELTGRNVREDIVSRIFERFCVGK